MYDEEFLAETLRIAFEDELYYKLPIGIRRHDYAHVHGWWLRIRRDRASFRKLFSDGVYGSPQESLRQAILYRHSILASFPVTIKYISNKMLPPEPEKRISRHVEKGKLRPYIYWKATWYNQDHKVETDTFPVHTLGEEEAKAMALQAATARHNKKPKLTEVADPHAKPQFEAGDGVGDAPAYLTTWRRAVA